MNLIIRECVIEDAAQLQHINRFEMGYDYSVEETTVQLQKLLKSNNNKIFVAVVDGEIAGYVHLNDYELIFAQSMKNIMGIAVSQKYRRCGVAKALIAKAEEWAKHSGAKGIRLVSGAKRYEAHEFYKAVGFKKTKEQFNFKKMF